MIGGFFIVKKLGSEHLFKQENLYGRVMVTQSRLIARSVLGGCSKRTLSFTGSRIPKAMVCYCVFDTGLIAYLFIWTLTGQ